MMIIANWILLGALTIIAGLLITAYIIKKVVLQKILSAPQRLGEDASPEAYLAAVPPEAARRKPRFPYQ